MPALFFVAMLFGLAMGWTRELAGGLLTLGSLAVYMLLSLGLTGRLPPDALYLIVPFLAGAGFLVLGLFVGAGSKDAARE